MSLLDDVIEAEGFEEKPYKDTLGNLTFGHGLTYITKQESYRIVEARLVRDRSKLRFERPFLSGQPDAVSDIVTEMRFQMGAAGVDSFKRMWTALMVGDFPGAAAEMRDSKWNAQTPNRCSRLSARMENIS